MWRHGRTEWNDAQRFQGQTDVALDEVGRRQAAQAARQLATLQPHIIVSSDMSRASDTADALAALVTPDVQVTPALREIDGGEWEGRYADELKSDPAYREWLAGADIPAGGAETRSAVADRAVAAVEAATADLPSGGVAVVVSHGGAIRALIGRMTGLPTEHWRVFGGLANCCWSVLEQTRSGGWRLVEHNASSLPQPVVGDDR